MKTQVDIRSAINNLQFDLRELINSYACAFDEIKVKKGNKIKFVDSKYALFEKKLQIDYIVGEGSNVGIYPKNPNYLSHSENTIEDIHDLFLILHLIETHINKSL